MDKKIFSTVLRRLHLATREHVGVEPIWRIMIVIAFLILVFLIGGGWYLYNWSIAESAVVNQMKPVAIPITEEELNKVQADVNQRSDHYEQVLATAPVVVPISGNIVAPPVAPVATGTLVATSSNFGL